MKKGLVVLISIIYLAAMSGIAVHTHYCGSHLISWSIGSKGDDCGDCEKQSGSKKCCKDEVISYKGSQEQNSVSAYKIKGFTTVDIAEVIPAVYYDIIPACYDNSCRPISRLSSSPPGKWQHIPLYKLHSSFVYYG